MSSNFPDSPNRSLFEVARYGQQERLPEEQSQIYQCIRTNILGLKTPIGRARRISYSDCFHINPLTHELQDRKSAFRSWNDMPFNMQSLNCQSLASIIIWMIRNRNCWDSIQAEIISHNKPSTPQRVADELQNMSDLTNLPYNYHNLSMVFLNPDRSKQPTMRELKNFIQHDAFLEKLFEELQTVLQRSNQTCIGSNSVTRIRQLEPHNRTLIFKAFVNGRGLDQDDPVISSMSVEDKANLMLLSQTLLFEADIIFTREKQLYHGIVCLQYQYAQLALFVDPQNPAASQQVKRVKEGKVVTADQTYDNTAAFAKQHPDLTHFYRVSSTKSQKRINFLTSAICEHVANRLRVPYQIVCELSTDPNDHKTEDSIVTASIQQIEKYLSGYVSEGFTSSNYFNLLACITHNIWCDLWDEFVMKCTSDHFEKFTQVQQNIMSFNSSPAVCFVFSSVPNSDPKQRLFFNVEVDKSVSSSSTSSNDNGNRLVRLFIRILLDAPKRDQQNSQSTSDTYSAGFSSIFTTQEESVQLTREYFVFTTELGEVFRNFVNNIQHYLSEGELYDSNSTTLTQQEPLSYKLCKVVKHIGVKRQPHPAEGSETWGIYSKRIFLVCSATFSQIIPHAGKFWAELAPVELDIAFAKLKPSSSSSSSI